MVKPAKQQTLVTGAKAEPAEAKKNLPATGDASPVGLAATAFAGVAAAFASLAALLAGFVQCGWRQCGASHAISA